MHGFKEPSLDETVKWVITHLYCAGSERAETSPTLHWESGRGQAASLSHTVCTGNNNIHTV